ncbi:MAG: hypothetical protein MK101_12200 [Phycisphaerales bacterium]|nr:hypothetical protein [Phycisphaerales bacterium]
MAMETYDMSVKGIYSNTPDEELITLRQQLGDRVRELNEQFKMTGRADPNRPKMVAEFQNANQRLKEIRKEVSRRQHGPAEPLTLGNVERDLSPVPEGITREDMFAAVALHALLSQEGHNPKGDKALAKRVWEIAEMVDVMGPDPSDAPAGG